MPDIATLLEVLPHSPFYARKLTGRVPRSLADCPFTTKAELVADQEANPPYGTNLARPLDAYTRMHQTSGSTTGRSLRWLDTPESWQWMLDNWTTMFGWMGLQPGERAFFAFSFGPFLGFWTAYDAGQQAGFRVLPAGGMSTPARLRQIVEHDATAVFCTPTYALHLAQTADAERVDLASSAVRALIVAGEPGGLIPGVRRRLEVAWGARVFDHYGLTEVGPVSAEMEAAPGAMRVVAGYVGEIIDPATLAPVPDGKVGELVLTNLGRLGSPLVRYRTGDLVHGERRGDGLYLVGGILGRTDDMIQVRGNNLYPSAIEAVLRRFSEVVEFRVEVDATGPLTEVAVTIEPEPSADGPDLAGRVSKALRDELMFRIGVTAVPPGTLPRFEMKARRLIRKKGADEAKGSTT